MFKKEEKILLSCMIAIFAFVALVAIVLLFNDTVCQAKTKYHYNSSYYGRIINRCVLGGTPVITTDSGNCYLEYISTYEDGSREKSYVWLTSLNHNFVSVNSRKDKRAVCHIDARVYDESGTLYQVIGMSECGSNIEFKKIYYHSDIMRVLNKDIFFAHWSNANGYRHKLKYYINYKVYDRFWKFLISHPLWCMDDDIGKKVTVYGFY